MYSLKKSFNLAYITDFHPKRGRPRNFPQMGEFDLSLISEFRSRPSFYDRNSPRFKDKLYNAREWQEISNKLGFDVSILKDRILQLRNRYNLEKRRIEQLREENPNKYYESPWPLYEHLHFLSDHIRARRSYKKLLPLNSAHNVAPELSNSCSNNSNIASHQVIGPCSGAGEEELEDEGEAHLNAQNEAEFPNGLLTVKMEDDSEETDGDTESQNNDSENNAFEPSALISETHSSSTHAYQQRQHQQQNQQQPSQRNYQNVQQQRQQKQEFQPQQQQRQHQHHQHQHQRNPTISIRRLDSLRQDFVDSLSSTHHKKRAHHTSFNQSLHNDDESAVSFALKRPRLSAREVKYAAFGNFISSSLLDLPANTALELVEKFTSDIVRALMEKTEQITEYENDQ